MLIDARRMPVGVSLRAPVCIVGAGAAGTTIALELLRAGIEVIVLDGGGSRAEKEAQDTYRGVVEDDGDHDPLERVRQKRLGGTTQQWGGRCAPLDRLDFEYRSYVGGSGWPIGYDDLEPYYRRAHPFLGLGAFEYGAGDAIPDGRPLLAPSGPDPSVTDEAIWRWGPPVKFWNAYGRELSSSPGARVYHHANVVRLESATAEGRVERVVFSAGSVEHTVESPVVVLAAGGLEVTRLLLVSNGQRPAGLGNSSGLVGRYYMTHPIGEVCRVRFTPPPPRWIHDYERTHDDVYCRRMLKVGPSEQRRQGLLNLAIAPWYPDPQDPAHDDPVLSAFALAKLGLARTRMTWKATGIHRRYGSTGQIGAHANNVIHGLPALVRFGGYWARNRWLAERRLPSFMRDVGDAPLRLRFDAEQSPDLENRVALSRDRDHFGVPRLSVRFRVSNGDRHSIARSLAVVAAELEQRHLASVELVSLADLEAMRFGDGTHQMGLTRMRDSPTQGVVDRHCRLHDSPNVYVASSSVFPTSGAVGPTLTIVALAIRIADEIKCAG